MKRMIFFCRFSMLVAIIFYTKDLLGQSKKKGRSIPRFEHVIIVGVDGMSPDGIRNASTPVLHQMAKQGAVKWNVRTVLPSSSSPNWASMFMGAGTEAHGIIDNDWGRQDYSLPAIVMDDAGIFPTIFGELHRQRPKAEIGIVYQWEGFARLVEASSLNHNEHGENEVTSTQSFCKYISEKKPVLAFLHLDHVDDAGHEKGHGTPAYYDAVSKADSLIGLVQQTISRSGIAGNTLFIVTADHGGIGFGHGGATEEEAEIAWFINGPHVKTGYQIQQPVYTYDLAATIAFALGIEAPYAWTGRPVKPAFAGYPEPPNPYKGNSFLPAPVIYPKPFLFATAGGLFIDTIPLVRIELRENKLPVYYTIDGSEPGKNSILYTKPFPLTHSAVVKAKGFDSVKGKAIITKTSSAFFRIGHSAPGPAIHVSYYEGKGWNHLPAFDWMQPKEQWNQYEFTTERNRLLQFSKEEEDYSFGMRMESHCNITETGNYRFFLRSDDGSRLYIDDSLVIDNDGDHGVIERQGTCILKSGTHKIRVDYYNGSGGYWLELRMEGYKLPRQIVFPEMLLAKNSPAPLPVSKHHFIVISHRADHVIAPENSLAAIDSAIAHQVDYVELDLRTTTDSALVIMHDATIDRTTNGKGQVKNMNISVLDTCTLKNSHETIPHFEWCLQHCQDKINIYLDYKDADVQKTMQLLTKYHFEKSVLVYINAPHQYTEWRKYAPQVPLIVSLPASVKTPDELEAFLTKYPAEVLDGNFNEYTPDMVNRAKALGVFVWPDIQGATEMDNWIGALKNGYDGFQTDHPQALIQWLQKKGIR